MKRRTFLRGLAASLAGAAILPRVARVLPDCDEYPPYEYTADDMAKIGVAIASIDWGDQPNAGPWERSGVYPRSGTYKVMMNVVGETRETVVLHGKDLPPGTIL